MTTGLHDNPSIYPTLPGRVSTLSDIDLFAPNGGVFRTCWEYVLTHNLTEGEGAAFWTAANLMYESRHLVAPSDHSTTPDPTTATETGA